MNVAWDDGSRKQSKSITVPAWLVERLVNAVAALADDPDGDTPVNLSHLICEGAYNELRRLEIARNGGRPFPAAPGRLKPGPGKGAMSGAWNRRRASSG